MDFSKPYDKVETYNLTVGPNGTAEPGPISISRDDAIAAKNKDGVIAIWGHAEWADIYHPEDIRPVSFCFKLIPVSSEGDEHIVFQPVPLKADCNTGMSSGLRRNNQSELQ